MSDNVTNRSSRLTTRPVGANAFYLTFMGCQIVYKMYSSCMEFNLVTYGFIAFSIGFFLAFSASLYAIARLKKFERAVSDLDWDSLADLAIDVQKLKKNAQKYQANVNAAQKLTQKEKMQLAIEQAQYQRQNPVTNIIGMER